VDGTSKSGQPLPLENGGVVLYYTSPSDRFRRIQQIAADGIACSSRQVAIIAKQQKVLYRGYLP
jgi:hypothetical protein